MSASPNITIAQQRALATALVVGHVFYASWPRGSGDRGGVTRKVREDLKTMGLLVDRPTAHGCWPSLELTAEGLAVALTLPDRESSASRQYWIETGRYLKYGDRPEFDPAAIAARASRDSRAVRRRRFKIEIYRDDMLIASKVLTSGDSYTAGGIAYRKWLVSLGIQFHEYDTCVWTVV